MEPTTIIASVDLASKLLPTAIDSLGVVIGSEKSGKILPKGSVSFEKLLAAQQAQSATAAKVTAGDLVSRHLSMLPEMQALARSGEWASLGFEIKENGELEILRADQSRHQVSLSSESQATLQELYQQTKQSVPSLFSGAEANKMEVSSLQSKSVGHISGNRMLMWKTV